MSVKLYLRDNTDGTVHEYGTNRHDALNLMPDGSLVYENLQNGTGTMFPDEGYSFCLADGTDPRIPDGEELDYGMDAYIDIGGVCTLRRRIKEKLMRIRCTMLIRRRKCGK